MASLRKDLGKQISRIPRPKIFSTNKLGMPQPDVTEEIGECQFFHVTVSEEEARIRPLIVYNSISGSEVPLQNTVSLDYLTTELSKAQPNYTISSVDPISAPDLFLSLTPGELQNFPQICTIEQFELVQAVASPTISEYRFVRLSKARIFGMNYADKHWHEIPLPGIKNEKKQRRDGTGPLPLLNEPKNKPGRKLKEPKYEPSFWDLIYVVLQPPLILEQIDSRALPHDLYPFQIPGIEFLMNNESALLADEMGTGKTVMTTVALRILMQKSRTHHALILCPVSVIREWKRHLADWAPELLTSFVRGTHNDRVLEWQLLAHVYVTSYDTLRSDIKSTMLTKEKLNQFDVVVLDEAQYIKNPDSGRAKSVKQLKAPQRWALTGTPMENKIEDLYSLFEFLRPGYLTSFDLNPAQVRKKIKPYCLRRRKVDVLHDLPPLQRENNWFDLDSDQVVAYHRLNKQLRDELIASSHVTKIDIYRNITKLKQICNFAPGKATSPKLEKLKDQIETVIASGEKVIVFSQFIGEGIDKLEAALRPYGLAKIVGGQTESVREAEITRFMSRKKDSAPVLLASVRAGGVGLNLAEASYVVHFDHWWNPAVMWQAESRAHRPAQRDKDEKTKRKSVNVYSYWMVDTVDERIKKILEEKGLNFQNIIDGLSEERIDELISTEEWLEKIWDIKKVQDQKPKVDHEILRTLDLPIIREKLTQITPSEFERLIKDLMHYLGYPNARVVGHKGDGGIDVISTRNTESGVVRVAAQCKRYSGMVGVQVARDFRGAIADNDTIEKGFLITTGEFTNECLRFCEKSGIIVTLSGGEVAKYVKQFGLVI